MGFMYVYLHFVDFYGTCSTCRYATPNFQRWKRWRWMDFDRFSFLRGHLIFPIKATCLRSPFRIVFGFEVHVYIFYLYIVTMIIMSKLNVWNMKNTKDINKKSIQGCNSAHTCFYQHKIFVIIKLFKNFPFCNQLGVPALKSLQKPQCANNVP